MSPLLAALLLAAADPVPPATPPRPPGEARAEAPLPDDEEVIRNLELLERLELLRHLELFDEGDDDPKAPPRTPPAR